jgi:uncharacterized protein (DUF488 family)
MRLFTIGHSNHSMEDFVCLLEGNGITLVVDVRTAPYSRYNPQFNKEQIEHALRAHDIEYAYAGKHLGGRPSDPSCYKSRMLPAEGVDYLHEVDYPEVMKRPRFVQGINRLLELAEEHRTAIMCSEENPEQCHRHHLIAAYLMAQHPEVEVEHIRGDGTVFDAAMILGSVDTVAVEQLPLFGN